MHSGKGNGKKKPRTASNKLSNKKLDTLLTKMLANKATLSDSGDRIDQKSDDLWTEMKQSIAIIKAQDELHKIMLQFEIDRRRKTFWNEKPKQNP